MLDGLNKYGLPVKYGIAGFFGGVIGAFISQAMELNDFGASFYVVMPIAAAIGGAVGGWIKQRSGKQS